MTVARKQPEEKYVSASLQPCIEMLKRERANPSSRLRETRVSIPRVSRSLAHAPLCIHLESYKITQIATTNRVLKTTNSQYGPSQKGSKDMGAASIATKMDERAAADENAFLREANRLE